MVRGVAAGGLPVAAAAAGRRIRCLPNEKVELTLGIRRLSC